MEWAYGTDLGQKLTLLYAGQEMSIVSLYKKSSSGGGLNKHCWKLRGNSTISPAGHDEGAYSLWNG